MQCPNCGRNVRSKTQCAYCGYKFNQADKKEQSSLNKRRQNDSKAVDKNSHDLTEMKHSQNLGENRQHVPVRRSLEKELAEAEKEAKLAYERSLQSKSKDNESEVDSDEAFKKRADEILSYPYTGSAFSDESTDNEEDYIVPKTKKTSFGKVLWSMFKWLILLAVFFLMFVYGPQLVGMVKSYLEPTINQNNEQPAKELENSQNSTETTSRESTMNAISDNSSKVNSNSEENQTTSFEDTAFQIEDSEVDVENYPMISINLDFAESLSDVDQETFTFKVKYNETETDLEDEFSLFKEGKKLRLSFNDPALSVIGEDTSQQKLLISAENFSESIAYEVPNKQDQAERIDELNRIVNDYFSDQETVALQIQQLGDKTPFVYENQTMEADRLIAWFILQRTFELLADETITLGQEIPVKTQLIASGDTGQVASQARDSYTVQELIDLTVQSGDASAMNHLVQLADGVNRFNYWLKESGYFATRMNAPLAIEEDSYITGAVTDVTDLANLLVKLAKNELIDEEYDALLKESVTLSPLTDKFPNYNANVTQRYELLTTEENPQLQHIAGIAQTVGEDYIYVVLTKNFNEPYDMNARMSQTINDILTQYLSNQEGNEPVENETSIENTQEPVQTTQVITSPPAYDPSATSVETVVEPTDNLYEGKQTENYYLFDDGYRKGTWYQDENGAWFYR
ncbi:class A beta-lactamase-related serine hydrolase [Facklamia sp. 7083-14-GEN3]|uniref:class A beta-lactamase-related serine hydrolase n=1 Tax=Facklamia sp. 7083-14-GEN3 TaxID=2973478 RepID=UPI00215D32B8|nr:class A beta-lactamase-related serine hydrolase [Facklamia sp. 7083-14-GEN3]MCR8969515.1 class A beta-lactamase-related serine hydrolase [Facklamia sp. 7083-14-GEN3]